MPSPQDDFGSLPQTLVGLASASESLDETTPTDVRRILSDCDLSPKTKIILKEDSDYKQNAYQYATTSRQGMAPGAVIYPGILQDIMTVIDYAKTTGIGLAVRTGGHQYSGLLLSYSGKRFIVLQFFQVHPQLLQQMSSLT